MRILKRLTLALTLLFPFLTYGNDEMPLFAGNMKSFKLLEHGM
jgi:hypothetical protein